MTKKEIKEQAAAYVKKNANKIFNNLNVYIPVGEAFKAGAELLGEENGNLKKRLEEAKDIIKDFLHLIQFITSYEDEKKLKDRAERFLGIEIKRMSEVEETK